MNPFEKANFLYHLYRGFNNETPEINRITALQCALLCCEQIIEQWEYIDTYIADMRGDLNPNLKYWIDVKFELTKMLCIN